MILIGVCLFVACLSRIKVQSLVDFNEVPAEEKLPLVCQITLGIPCMPVSPLIIAPLYTDVFIFPFSISTISHNGLISPRRSYI